MVSRRFTVHVVFRKGRYAEGSFCAGELLPLGEYLDWFKKEVRAQATIGRQENSEGVSRGSCIHAVTDKSLHTFSYAHVYT